MPQGLFEHLLEQPLFFNLSQLPFSTQKFAMILKHSDLQNVRSVLDVGCGPGTNAPRFAHTKYLGIDINPRYIELARNRYRRDFLVADVTSSQAIPAGSFDYILLNSFLHHVDNAAADRILSRAGQLLTPDGHVHSVELVLPDTDGLPHWLAQHDRGKFPRSLAEWREIFSAHLQTVVFQPFTIRHLGFHVMQLVYFKGRAKS